MQNCAAAAARACGPLPGASCTPKTAVRDAPPRGRWSLSIARARVMLVRILCPQVRRVLRRRRVLALLPRGTRCGCSRSTRPSRSEPRWRRYDARSSSGRARRTSCRSTRTRGSPTSGTRSSSRCCGARRATSRCSRRTRPRRSRARVQLGPAIHVRERVLEVARRGVDRAARRVRGRADARRAAGGDAAPVPYAPFVAAGFFVAPARFLAEVPFARSCRGSSWARRSPLERPAARASSPSSRRRPAWSRTSRPALPACPSSASGARAFARRRGGTYADAARDRPSRRWSATPESAPANSPSAVLAHLDDYGLGTVGGDQERVARAPPNIARPAASARRRTCASQREHAPPLDRASKPAERAGLRLRRAVSGRILRGPTQVHLEREAVHAVGDAARQHGDERRSGIRGALAGASSSSAAATRDRSAR